MRANFVVLMMISAIISGCATSGGGGFYQNPIDNLRTLSINKVRGLAAQTLEFHTANGDEKTISAVQDVVRQSLKDPDSAKFQNVRLRDFEGGKVVCGEVNGKNSYGAYAGFTPFVGGITGSTMLDISSRYPDVNNASNAGIYLACGR